VISLTLLKEKAVAAKNAGSKDTYEQFYATKEAYKRLVADPDTILALVEALEIADLALGTIAQVQCFPQTAADLCRIEATNARAAIKAKIGGAGE
jgi:hypothetical protein